MVFLWLFDPLRYTNTLSYLLTVTKTMGRAAKRPRRQRSCRFTLVTDAALKKIDSNTRRIHSERHSACYLLCSAWSQKYWIISMATSTAKSIKHRFSACLSRSSSSSSSDVWIDRVKIHYPCMVKSGVLLTWVYCGGEIPHRVRHTFRPFCLSAPTVVNAFYERIPIPRSLFHITVIRCIFIARR